MLIADKIMIGIMYNRGPSTNDISKEEGREGGGYQNYDLRK